MSKSHKPRKLHVEITPANQRRIEAFLEEYNSDPARVTPRFKISHVVNRALDEFLSERVGPPAGAGGES